MKIIPPSFYSRDTTTVARELLGSFLIRELHGHRLVGMIVETEAYTCDDKACHAYSGKTISNSALFGPIGYAYIYFIYGLYFCVNVVARPDNMQAGGVLIRALEPKRGIPYMQKNRYKKRIQDLTNGPGKLCQALAITKELYGSNLTTKGPLYITYGFSIPSTAIVVDQRIGISRAKELPRRFYIKNNVFVSKIS